MDGSGRFSFSRFGSRPEVYMRPPFGNSLVQLSSFVVLAQCTLSLGIVVKAWSHLSLFAIAWIGFSMIWAILLFRTVLRTRRSLEMLFATGRLDPIDTKSPLGELLGVIGHFSKMVVLCSFWSISGLLMAIGLILSWR
jgi:hypothetical protein